MSIHEGNLKGIFLTLVVEQDTLVSTTSTFTCQNNLSEKFQVRLFTG